MTRSKNGAVKFQTSLCGLKGTGRKVIDAQVISHKRQEYKLHTCVETGKQKLIPDGYTEPQKLIQAQTHKAKLSTYVRVDANGKFDVNMLGFPTRTEEPKFADITGFQNKTLGDMHSAKLELERAKEFVKQKTAEYDAKAKQLEIEKEAKKLASEKEANKVKEEGETDVK